MHLSDEYPIKFESERLPPPIVTDLNGDGKKEVLVATPDAKIQVQFQISICVIMIICNLININLMNFFFFFCVLCVGGFRF